METRPSKAYEKIDLIQFLQRLPQPTPDCSLADCITAKNNTVLTYKDMAHTNAHGLIRGFQFSALVFQHYSLATDSLIFGLQKDGWSSSQNQIPCWPCSTNYPT
ncbi:hypothetical protein BDM02DRAFT_3119597 [Thelephora ganbajun]|uniref:Uncharacterized protein n=1 Tax=Thelephora ganbajun TaxID=370292 RepID=A0ACB6Z889_THEGA|nr:hypothetical protein BDM02DRAFT_3119597 [Thelephora ganbajun]